jgi:hypothetical protein
MVIWVGFPWLRLTPFSGFITRMFTIPYFSFGTDGISIATLIEYLPSGRHSTPMSGLTTPKSSFRIQMATGRLRLVPSLLPLHLSLLSTLTRKALIIPRTILVIGQNSAIHTRSFSVGVQSILWMANSKTHSILPMSERRSIPFIVQLGRRSSPHLQNALKHKISFNIMIML